MSIKSLIEGTEKRLCKLELVDIRVESLEESPGFNNHYKIAIRDHVRVPKFWRTRHKWVNNKTHILGVMLFT